MDIAPLLSNVENVVLDGEIVALDDHGRPSFQLLQRHKQTGGAADSLHIYLFDLLNFENRSLLARPLTLRKELLEELLRDAGDPVRYSAAFASGQAVLAQARRNRIEGIIGKRADSTYQPGRRGRCWVKVKLVWQQEFVIGGYTEPKGTRDPFGAVLAGYYQQGQLRFASKVGTGFDSHTLQALFAKFQALRTDTCPFVRIDARPSSRGGLTPAEKRRCTWLKPELVCKVKFAEWTHDGGLRQPVFLGLRDDRQPTEVVREQPLAAV